MQLFGDRGERMENDRKDFLSQLTMTKRERELALQRLMDKQKEFQEHLEGESSMDESDQALREISASSNYSLIERKLRELKKIDRLIRQVTQDTHFGVCEECGDPIPPERLLIVPETTLCVACQRELEKFDILKRTPRNNALRLPMEPVNDPEDDDFPMINQEGIDVEIDLAPLVDLDESLDTSFSKDA